MPQKEIHIPEVRVAKLECKNTVSSEVLTVSNEHEWKIRYLIGYYLIIQNPAFINSVG